MKMLEINFSPSGDVFDIFTKAILPNNLSSDLLKHDELGDELYSNFIKERINGNLSGNQWKDETSTHSAAWENLLNLWEITKKFTLKNKETLKLGFPSLVISDLN